MMESNTIPILAAIVEPLIGIGMLINGLLIFNKYKQRRSQATLILAFSILAFGIAASISGIGKILHYTAPDDSLNISGFTIVIAYIFTALANIFAMEFLAQIFREGKSRLSLLFTTANGITIGFLLPNISFADDAYDAILLYLIWHILVSLATYGTLSYYSFKEARVTEQKVPKTGFKMIGWYGISVNLLFIFFVVDLAWGIARAGDGYTPAYYVAWFMGVIASLMAYLGYVMPAWLKNRLS
ncbi:MAG: hypothetical protein INQ03_09665 [Candidatus Heimdallarchaeota archaeon]|nr:hypothetical protein [Candidatus Heimdallarchaeota archaeon]